MMGQLALDSYLLGFVFWLSIPLGCLGLSLLYHLVGGRWGAAIRPYLDAGLGTMGLFIPLVLPLLFGVRLLYPWARPDAAADAAIAHKAAYLNVPFFVIRTAAYFLIWLALALLYRRSGLGRGPIDPHHERTARLCRLSGPSLVLFALSVTFALWDLTATLDPRWYSTVYGLLMLMVQALLGLSFVALVWSLRERRELRPGDARTVALHDVGNLLLSFVMLWAYLSFVQLLITWSGNLPDEVRFYVPRLRGAFGRIGLLLVAFHFALPFLALLSRGIKRRPLPMALLSLVILAGGWLDLFWMIAPAFQRRLILSPLDLVATVAIGGLFVWIYLWQLGNGRPQLPATQAGAPHVA